MKKKVSLKAWKIFLSCSHTKFFISDSTKTVSYATLPSRMSRIIWMACNYFVSGVCVNQFFWAVYDYLLRNMHHHLFGSWGRNKNWLKPTKTTHCKILTKLSLPKFVKHTVKPNIESLWGKCNCKYKPRPTKLSMKNKHRILFVMFFCNLFHMLITKMIFSKICKKIKVRK